MAPPAAPEAPSFPRLGSGKASSATGPPPSAWSRGPSGGLNLSAALQVKWLHSATLKALQAAGNNDPAACTVEGVRAVYEEQGGDMAAAQAALEAAHGVRITVSHRGTLPSTRRRHVASTGQRGSAEAAVAATALARRLRWVDTGVSASATYKGARDKAEQYAVARNKCFGRATQAYLAGKGALARKWSREGRALDRRMRQAHAQAAAAIFAQRNAGFQGSASDGLAAMDVHGLHPDEAVDAVAEGVATKGVSLGGPPAVWLAVVVGTGHHSYGGQDSGSEVAEAVRRWAEGAKVVWCEVGQGDGRGGTIMIQM